MIYMHCPTSPRLNTTLPAATVMLAPALRATTGACRLPCRALLPRPCYLAGDSPRRKYSAINARAAQLKPRQDRTPMRIAVGGFMHETNTFVATPTTWDDFVRA